MGLEAFIIRYGYFALFAGSLLEGEAIVLASGFAAHRGWLSLPLVIVVAAVAAAVTDQAFFLIGRYRREWLQAKMPKLAARVNAAATMMEGREGLAIIAARFIYGMRIAGAVGFGATSIGFLRYSIWNAAGAVIWASVFACAGYAFGATAMHLLEDLAHYEEPVFIALLVSAGVFSLWRSLRRKSVV